MCAQMFAFSHLCPALFALVSVSHPSPTPPLFFTHTLSTLELE